MTRRDVLRNMSEEEKAALADTLLHGDCGNCVYDSLCEGLGYGVFTAEDWMNAEVSDD